MIFFLRSTLHATFVMPEGREFVKLATGISITPRKLSYIRRSLHFTHHCQYYRPEVPSGVEFEKLATTELMAGYFDRMECFMG